MEDYLVEELAEVVTRVKEVLWDLQGPVRTPPEAFFDIDNLWKIEIPSTCRQSIEYVRGVMLLIDQGLNRPAAALSRSIHVCYIRFEYLSDHEEELPDWFHWRRATITTQLAIRCATLPDCPKRTNNVYRKESRMSRTFWAGRRANQHIHGRARHPCCSK